MRGLCMLVVLALPLPAASQTLAEIEKQADEAFAQAYLVCSIYQNMVEECTTHANLSTTHRVHNRGDIVLGQKPKMNAEQCNLYMEEKKGLGKDCQTLMNDPAGAYQSLVEELLPTSRKKSTKR